MEKKKDLKELFRALKFLLISISAGVIQFGSFALLDKVIFPYASMYWVSYLISLTLSVAWNFTINRKYTFKSANNVKVAMLQVAAFYVVFTPASLLLGQLAVDAGWESLLVEALTMVANFVLEFLYTRFFVYRNSCDTAVKKETLTSAEETVEETTEETKTNE